MEIASVAIASLSFIAAFFLLRIVEWLVWKIDTMEKVAIFMSGVYIFADMINYIVLLKVLRYNELEPILKRKAAQLSILIISFLSVVIGLVRMSMVA